MLAPGTLINKWVPRAHTPTNHILHHTTKAYYRSYLIRAHSSATNCYPPCLQQHCAINIQARLVGFRWGRGPCAHRSPGLTACLPFSHPVWHTSNCLPTHLVHQYNCLLYQLQHQYHYSNQGWSAPERGQQAHKSFDSEEDNWDHIGLQQSVYATDLVVNFVLLSWVGSLLSGLPLLSLSRSSATLPVHEIGCQPSLSLSVLEIRAFPPACSFTPSPAPPVLIHQPVCIPSCCFTLACTAKPGGAGRQ